MNTKQVKNVVKKNVKLAQEKGVELKGAAKIEYDKLKKQINMTPAQAKALEQKAIKEYEKVKKQMENTAKKAEGYMKKNPGKAALISAGIGAALAGAAALWMTSGDSKKKTPAKKKK